MIKLILISLLIASSLYAKDEVLISGLSYHSKPRDKAGEEYNYLNYGIGYRHSQSNYAITAIAMRDSYNYPFLGASISPTYEVDGFVIGLELGAAWRSVKYTTNWTKAKYKQEFTPLMGVRLTYDWLNIMIAPPESDENVWVVYMNIGVEL